MRAWLTPVKTHDPHGTRVASAAREIDLPRDESLDILGLAELPAEWRSSTLGSLSARVLGGGTPSTKVAEYWDGDIPWTTSALLAEDDIYLRKHQRLITVRGLQESSTQLAPAGSVLIGTRVGVGKTAVAAHDIAISQDLTAIVLRPQSSAEFLALALRSPRFVRWFQQSKRGTTISGVPRSDVMRLMLPQPPLPEQRAIASVLRSAQRAKEACERDIATTRQLKQSLLDYLFTYGPVPFDRADQVPLKDTPAGRLPGAWNVACLGEVAKLRSGGTPSKANVEFWSGQIPWASPKDLKLPRLHDTEDHISDAGLAEGSKLVFAGSILIVIRGMILSRDIPVSMAMVSMALNQDLKAIVPGERVCPDYLLYALLVTRRFLVQQIGTSAHGTRRISTAALEGLPIPLPPLPTQLTIASHLSAVDAKLAAEEARRAALDNLFKSLLHHLMTGKVRVNHLIDHLTGQAPGQAAHQLTGEETS